MPNDNRSDDRDTHWFVRHVAVNKFDRAPQATAGSAPAKEFAANGVRSASRAAEGQTGSPDMPGRHVVFLIARTDGGDYPIVRIVDQDENGGEAFMLFTTREAAILYLQVARSNEHSVVSVSPQEAAHLIQALRGEHVDWMVIDPNRRHQEDGLPAGPVISIKTFDYDPTGENLYQEIFDSASHRQTK